MLDMNFYKGKNVFITGHTGFKGSWLCEILAEAGANVTGYALEPPTTPNLYEVSNAGENIHSVTGDINDIDLLMNVFQKAKPEIVFHLAAQPLVRESYKNPINTYATNVMGTVHICECVRQTRGVRSFVNITTDKVYKNNEWEWGYRETDHLDGYDPYSNSKSCSELVTHSYIKSFFNHLDVAVSTARAGNVIGGGDFAADRIIPDCVRAAWRGEVVSVRNPHSVRPYQHVLEPLFAYLLIAKRQYEDKECAGYYNVGPEECDCIHTGALVELFCDKWGEGMRWEADTMSGRGLHEANYLKLDCSRIKQKLGWRPKWNIEQAVEQTVEWSKAYIAHDDVQACMRRQIQKFIER